MMIGTRGIAGVLMLFLLFPAPALAGKRSTASPPESAASNADAPAPSITPDGPRQSGPTPDEEYDRQMRSANGLITAGYILSFAGGLAAVGGGIYVAVKPSKRIAGAVIASSGLALGLTGGLLTILGYHKRSSAAERSFSFAPAIDPERRMAGLTCAARF